MRSLVLRGEHPSLYTAIPIGLRDRSYRRSASLTQEERIRILNDRPARDGTYVLYWMQASQRTEFNHALEYAIPQTNKLDKPLVVFFGLTEDYPEANERHYASMLEGLREVQSSLRKRGMQMVIRRGPPDVGAADLSRDASLVVADKGYLGMQKGWIRYVADHIDCPLIQVEANVVVPVGDASPKEEYMAATLRPKITKKLHRYLVAPAQSRLKKNSLRLDFDSLDIEDGENALSALHINRDVKRVHSFHGGTSEAKKLLAKFLAEKLPRYAELRNDPTRDCLSHLSPYLHFGQISPLYIALRVLESRASAAAKEAYLEELIVRRELSMNFTYYNDHYDSLAGLPLWARNTLTVHGKDRREHLYTLKELEQAQTHDPYWNAAQKEMTTQGKMHSYMRMCWGKRIIEWTETPEKAFKVGLHLNDKYGLDGRGPNGYTGVAWCFGKHDRAWRERPIYGKI